ncbi:hypothetical protein JL720_1351 [Aureococcus anophagefferens]|nr:hypothetical protein JL720_1351 [Aureococcus anophagefferens]
MIVLRRLALAALALERAHAFGDVRELNDETFDSVVDGSAHVLVEFYKPDCGHCQTMEPEFYKTAEALEFESDVILARVDTEESPKVGKRFAIDGHPIFRWFKKGGVADDKFYFVHYSGRMANTFLKMIGERTGGEYPKLDIEVSKVRKIKSDDFESVVLDPARHTLCAMYTPWTESSRRAADATPVRYEGADDEVERFVEFVNKETGLDLDPLATAQGATAPTTSRSRKLAGGEAPSYLADGSRASPSFKDTSLSSAKRKDFSARKNILNAFAVAATAANGAARAVLVFNARFRLA